MRRKSPVRVPRKPTTPDDGSWLGMTRDRLSMAATAVSCDHEDVTDEQRDALNEFINLGGNPWAL